MLQLNTPLTTDEIEFRIQSINAGGYATILPYKDARADMRRLDAVYGVDGWQRKHEFKNGLLYCSVGIYSEKIKDWVWKEDVGTQSNAEKEKGQASDSFKRACFNLGIGRELYDYPVISIKLISNNNSKDGEWFLDESRKNKYGKPTPSQGWGLKLKEWKWLTQFDGEKLTFIAAQDNHGNTRFQYGKLKKVDNNG